MAAWAAGFHRVPCNGLPGTHVLAPAPRHGSARARPERAGERPVTVAPWRRSGAPGLAVQLPDGLHGPPPRRRLGQALQGGAGAPGQLADLRGGEVPVDAPQERPVPGAVPGLRPFLQLGDRRLAFRCRPGRREAPRPGGAEGAGVRQRTGLGCQSGGPDQLALGVVADLRLPQEVDNE